MMCGSDGKENSELKGHPYLKESGKAVKVNNVYDDGNRYRLYDRGIYQAW